jgi:hypothetical protein
MKTILRIKLQNNFGIKKKIIVNNPINISNITLKELMDKFFSKNI